MAANTLPRPIEERATRHRSALTSADAEVLDAADPPVVGVGATTVLLAGVLPDDADRMLQTFRRLRAELPDGVTIRIVDEERPLRPESGTKRAIGRLRGRDSTRKTSIIESLRIAGWTIASVDRIELDDAPARLWVDLSAVDLSTIAAESGEGDRDQRSE